MPPFDQHQKIGFEVECADVILNMGRIQGDTYGIEVIRTQEVENTTQIPLFAMVLEERKGRENPKIEVTTAPGSIDLVRIGRRKEYLNAIADLAGGKTAQQWAAAASRVVYPGSMNRKAWIVSTSYPNEFAALSFIKKEQGARLPQCNVDLYLRQLYTASPLLQKMMHGADRKRFYTASRTCASTWSNTALVGLPVNGREDIRGLLTLALYNALCEITFSGDPNSLGKDRTQPLPKVGVDDLARLVLTPAEQTGLLNLISHVVAQARGKPQSLRKLSQDSSSSRRLNEDLVEEVKGYLKRWFAEARMRYTIDTDPARCTMQVELRRTAIRRENPRNGVQPAIVVPIGGRRWDAYHGTAVTQLGNRVWWDCRGEPGATPTGKPIFPKRVNNQPLMVVEVRNSKTDFTKEYYMNL